MTRAFIVLNPAARGGNAALVQAALQRHRPGAGWECQVHQASEGENITDTVRSMLGQGFDLFVAAGGDGTVSGVASGLLGSGLPLGILPAGTGNVVARELGIPTNLDRALALLAGPHATRTIDAMQVGDQLYLLATGAGISGRVMRDTARDAKRRFGRLSYFWPALIGLFGLQLARFEVEVDGNIIPARASDVTVVNSGAAGDPHMRWGPNVRWDDGQLDVCIVRARTLLDYLVLAGRALVGRPSRDRNLRFLTAQRSVIIRSEEPLPAQGDGDYIGQTPLHVQLLPAAVRLIVPLAKGAASGVSSLLAHQP